MNWALRYPVRYKILTNERYYLVPYNTLADVRLLAERSNTKSNNKWGGFQTQLHASYVSSHTEELWYNEIDYIYILIINNQ